MGSHRSGTSSRGVARWLIAAVIAVILVIAVIVGMVWLSGRSEQQGKDAAASCVRGDLQVRVVVAPSLVGPLQRIADGFNSSGTVSADYCGKVEVSGIDSPIALGALSGTWDTKLGGVPSLWIPESSIWTARLAVAKPSEVSGQPSSVASSPVVLASRASARQSFDGVRWLDLPAKQSDLKVALPTGGDADGTYLAAQSVAAAVARTGGAAISEEAAKGPLVSGTLSRWKSAAPKSSAPNEAASREAGTAALDALTVPGDTQAVPVTEQQLYAYARGREGAVPVGVYPSGPTAAATYPALVLEREDLDEAHHRIAADFATFVTKTENAKPLADAGFRIPRQPTPAKTPSIDFGTVEPLAPASNAAAIAIADTLNQG